MRWHGLGVWVMGVMLAQGATLRESFERDPAANGWRVYGEASLFRWDAASGRLEATWDSSKTNSFFAWPLGTVLSRTDDFEVAFDLQLDQVRVGVDPTKPYSFQLALGLVEWASATRASLFRGSGVQAETGPRNLVEFDYFPDSGFGATVSPAVVSSNNQFAASFTFPLELAPHDTFRVTLRFQAADGVLRTGLTRNGMEDGPVKDAVLALDFADFRVDTFAVCSYSDAGQDPQYGGSLWARGAVDNVVVALPDPPVAEVRGGWSGAAWGVDFQARAGWRYRLERAELADGPWLTVTNWAATQTASARLTDPAPPATRGFYRVGAEKP